MALRSGALLEDLEAVAPTEVVDPQILAANPWWVQGASHLRLSAVARRLHEWRSRRQTAWARRARVVLLNSVASASILRHLDGANGLILVYVHELRHAIDISVNDGWAALANVTHRFLAASDAVANELRRRGIPDGSITVCREFVDLNRLTQPKDGAARHDALVASMGSIDHRKGSDLFVQLAILLRERLGARRLRFRWIGSWESDRDAARWMRHDIACAGLSETLELTGELADPSSALHEADIFVLTSREDPFPLACLEAALAGKPIVAFDCGGMRELLEGAAIFVPVPRVDLMAREVHALLDDPDRRARLGDAARQLVERHASASVGAGRVVDVIAQHLNTPSRK